MSQLAPPQLPVPPAPRVRGPRARATLGSRMRLLVVIVVIVGAIGYLLYEGLGNAAIYFRTADQAVAQKVSLGDRRFRIEGTVLPGLRNQGDSVEFVISANGVNVPIVHTGPQPPLFKSGVPVVLEGRWSTDGTYYASDRILVKHDENYKTAHPDRLSQAGATQ
jgi:cytochrome c-type biogenesis protein CcmE